MISPDRLAEILPDIVKAGLSALPQEAVGLICPDGTIFYLTNESESDGSYEVSSEQLATAFYHEDGVESLGFSLTDVVVWHTHPSGFIGPSMADLQSRRQSGLVDMAHLVVALPTGEASFY